MWIQWVYFKTKNRTFIIPKGCYRAYEVLCY